MFDNIKIVLVLLLLFACSSTSMEFRSAKSATRAEKDLKRGEEWALKALNMDMEKDNALIPYFLATEIYKPQEKWGAMAEMLDEAIRRNPEQKLEKPKLLVSPEELTKENYDEMVVETIGEGVKVYREEAWTSIYNQAIENINAGANDIALRKLNLCINEYKLQNSNHECVHIFMTDGEPTCGKLNTNELIECVSDEYINKYRFW